MPAELQSPTHTARARGRAIKPLAPRGSAGAGANSPLLDGNPGFRAGPKKRYDSNVFEKVPRWCEEVLPASQCYEAVESEVGLISAPSIFYMD